MMNLLHRLKIYLGLVRFSHTVFALPFALTSALVAAQGIPEERTLVWILVCMVGARTAAMTFNRLVDLEIDSQNPRTRNRHLPAGIVRPLEAALLWVVSAAVFVFGAWMLNSLAFSLSPVALAVICGYSFCKRFTALSHFVLGFSLAIAPVGAWIAVTGSFALPPLILALGVLLWVAGFDIIYALLDEGFDRRTGLHSLVVALGRSRALRVAFVSHLASVVIIGVFGLLTGMGWIYGVGILAFAVLIVYEHALVRPGDAARINRAFFHVNTVISIGLFFMTFLDIHNSRRMGQSEACPIETTKAIYKNDKAKRVPSKPWIGCQGRRFPALANLTVPIIPLFRKDRIITKRIRLFCHGWRFTWKNSPIPQTIRRWKKKSPSFGLSYPTSNLPCAFSLIF